MLSIEQKDADISCANSVHDDEGVSSGHLTTPPTDFEEDGITTEQLEQIWSWNTPIPPTLKTCMHELWVVQKIQLYQQRLHQNPPKPVMAFNDRVSNGTTFKGRSKHTYRRHAIACSVGHHRRWSLCREPVALCQHQPTAEARLDEGNLRLLLLLLGVLL